MIDVTAVIVGINGWEEYTLPFIRSILRFEPNMPIVLIDNASEQAYPSVDGVKIIRTPRVCYAAALNIGMRNSPQSAYWLILNNDVLCTAPFLDHIHLLPGRQIHANEIGENNQHHWFVSWCVVIPSVVWHGVGEFDEGFEVCGFEDVDYSMRTQKEGFGLNKVSLPFEHFGGKTRWDMPGYPAQRMRNIEYFNQKWGFSVCSEYVDKGKHHD